MTAIILVRGYADSWIARVSGWSIQRSRTESPEAAARAAAEALAARLAGPGQPAPPVKSIRELARGTYAATYQVEIQADS
jgi:hypothetical protein